MGRIARKRESNFSKSRPRLCAPLRDICTSRGYGVLVRAACPCVQKTRCSKIASRLTAFRYVLRTPFRHGQQDHSSLSPILFTALPSALPRFTPNILLRRRLESTLSIRHRWRVKKEDRPDLFSPRPVPVCLSIQIDFTLFLRRSRTKVDRPTSTVGASIAIH